jgi:hypothetical protein
MNANTWELDPVPSSTAFLSAVARHLPEAHTASFEIRGACPEARRVYSEYSASIKYRPIRDTIWPRTHLYYCRISETLSQKLDQVLHEHKPAKVFWHIKGFSDQKMLFSFHDADSRGSVCLSPNIALKVIRTIAVAMGCKPRKIETRYVWEQDCSGR